MSFYADSDLPSPAASDDDHVRTFGHGHDIGFVEGFLLLIVGFVQSMLAIIEELQRIVLNITLSDIPE